MKEYKTADVCMIGRRIHNTKRNYLLVNPLQGKHIPAIPSRTYALCTELGRKLREQTNNVRIVIGFAETATAVGAIAAMSFDDDVIYQHTTREKVDWDNMVVFREEHSHAVCHQLNCEWLSELSAGTVILIDDEISTGNTIVNMITALRNTFPGLRNVRFVVGSVLNQMPSEKIAKLKQEQIDFVCLVRTENNAFSAEAEKLFVEEPVEVKERSSDFEVRESATAFPDMRRGMTVGEIKKAINELTNSVTEDIMRQTGSQSSVVVIGTEECMLPAIMTGLCMEHKHTYRAVYTHATTRSPIGVCPEKSYPCRNGFVLPGFYDSSRKTYLYNTGSYDTVVIMTDSTDASAIKEAMCQVTGMFDADQIFLVRG